MKRDPNCTKCILHQSSKHVCIWGSGEGEGFVVGEAPGKNEARTGQAFTGDAGMLLRPILKKFGLDDPFITNVAKCRPPDNRKPERDEIKACLPYLHQEIADQNPKAILLLGATAMKAMIGKASITEMNGQVVEKNGQTFVCAFHPAYILRDPSKRGQLEMAIKRYAHVLNGGTFEQEMPKWRAIESSTFDEFFQDWLACDHFAFDCETAGEQDGDGLLYWKEGFEITSIAFSLGMPDGTEKNWGLAMPGHPSAVLDFDAAKDFIIELTSSQGPKRAIGANGKFDNLCLLSLFGVCFRLDSDVGLGHHLTDENSSNGLKEMARTNLNAPDYDLTKKEKQNTRLVPIRRLLGYNCADTAWTRRLDPLFLKKMDDQEEWLYRKVIIPAARLFQEIELEGHYVDTDYLEKSAREAQQKRDEVLKKMNKMAGREINWNSPQQVAQLLFKDMGLVPTVFTAKINPETGERDNPSTGEEALIDLDHPIAKLIEEYRGHEKFLSTYTGEPDENGVWRGGWRDFMDGPHLYLSTKLHGTVTGRYSSRMHQTPRDGSIRNAVDAPPGWTFVQIDLSQAELRVAAILSHDAELTRCFKEEEDVHWRTLMDAVKIGGGDAVDLVMSTAPLFTKMNKLDFEGALQVVWDAGRHDPDVVIKKAKDWKEWRKKAKGINFGFVFGQQPPGFITYAKTKYGFEPTLVEATNFRNAYFNLYPGVAQYHERQIKLVYADGFVRSMSGRKRRLPGIYSRDRLVRSECERQAINSPIQGFIGDYKAMIMVELVESFPRNQLRIKGEVHDSILMWVKNEHLKHVLPRLHHISEHPKLAREAGLNFPIRMATDIEVGRWGAGEKWRAHG